MITVSNRTADIDSQLNECMAQMNALQMQWQQLEELKRQPMTWKEQTDFRVVLSDEAVLKIMIANKALVDLIYSNPSIIAEKDGGTTYVYLNFIEDADRELIINSGGVIEPQSL